MQQEIYFILQQMHLSYSIFSYRTLLIVTPSLTPVLLHSPLIIPHPGWSSPPSWQGAGRPAGSWRRGARRGWGDWERKTRSFFVRSPQRSHQGRALHSSHRKLHDDLQGPLRGQRETQMQQRRHYNVENTSEGWESKKTTHKDLQELSITNEGKEEMGCIVLWNEKHIKKSLT